MLRIARSVLIFSSFILFFGCAGSTDSADDSTEQTTATESPAAETVYDAKMAEEIGADAYGMKKYVLAFLKRGPNRDRSPEEAKALQKAHMDNIGRMAEAGQLVLAGPFMDDGDIRGIYVFDVETIEEAEALTATDPAIQAGSLVMELHPWYGTAALLKLAEIYPKIMKEEI